MNMLENAEVATAWAAQDPPSVVQPSSLMLAAMKAMNRAGGFLEAVSIVLPELGPELLDEFESFASKVDSLSITNQPDGELRIPGARHSSDDRRAGDRRLRHDRRRHSMAVSVERRGPLERSGSLPTAVGEHYKTKNPKILAPDCGRPCGV